MRARDLNPMRHLAIWLGGRTWFLDHAHFIPRLDLLLRRLTFGRITLLTFAGLPELFLTVAGRKSGMLRTTPLLCVPYDGPAAESSPGWLVGGSNWGQPKPPAWLFNLLDAETATVDYRGRRTTVVARRLEGDERAAAWAAMLRVWPNYAKYGPRAGREIPVVLLTPTP